VERISREHGANSVSDFVRRLVTNSGLSILIAEPDTHGVLAQVAALQRQVDWLSGLVEQGRRNGGLGSTPAPPDGAGRPGATEKCEVPAGSVSRWPSRDP
jgi:hypothetical protein